MMKEKLYFIAVIPDQNIQDQVTELKEVIRDKFGSKHALKSPPHITLHMPFKWKEAKEKVIMETLSGFVKEKDSFPLMLSGFNSFPPRVIYVDVLKSQPLIDLQSNLIKEMKVKMNLFNANYKDRGFHPHMTIAHRDLKKPMYSEAWTYFKERQVDFDFTVKSIFLLKHNGKNWDVYQEFEFY